jgi:Flp pilus assembly pilin Flp
LWERYGEQIGPWGQSLPNKGANGRSLQTEKPHAVETFKVSLRSLRLLACEDGQDLVEYAPLIALICIAAVAGINRVADAITTAFTNISISIA